MHKPGRFLQKWLKLFELDRYQARCKICYPRKSKGLLKGDAAMIDIALGEKKLEIFLNPKNRKAWNESLIVHELTHVFLYRLWECVDQLIRKGFRSRKAQAALRAQYENLEEEAVDRLVAIFLKLNKFKHHRGSKTKIHVLQGGLRKRRFCA